MKPYIYLLLIPLLLLSCEKKTVIKGQVFNPVTGEGIEDITVSLAMHKVSVFGGYDGSGSKLIATATTDVNGRYIFEERIRKNRIYNLRFNVDDDIYKIIEGALKNIGQEDNNKDIDYPLIPKANITQIIKNTK